MPEQPRPDELRPDDLKAMLDDLVADLPDGPADLEQGRRLVAGSRRRSMNRQRVVAITITAVAALLAVVFVVPRLRSRDIDVATSPPVTQAPVTTGAPPSSAGTAAPTSQGPSTTHRSSSASTAPAPVTLPGAMDVGDLDGDGRPDRVAVVNAGGTRMLGWEKPAAELVALPETATNWRILPAGNVDGRAGTEFFATFTDPANRTNTTITYLYTVVNGRLQVVEMNGSPLTLLVSRWAKADMAGEALAFGFTCSSAGLKLEEVNTETTYTRLTTTHAWAGPGKVREGVQSRQSRQSLTAAQIDKIGTGSCGTASISPPR